MTVSRARLCSGVIPFCFLAHLLTCLLAYYQADSSEAGKYYAKVMAKVQGAPDFVNKEIARLTKMKVSQ